MQENNIIYIDLLSISSSLFLDYGWVLTKPDEDPTIETKNVRQWFSIVPMDGFLAQQSISYFETKKMPIICDMLECIFYDDEAYINIGTSRSIIFVAAPHKDNKNKPDEHTIKAFLIPPGVSVIIKRGVWHWAPYPVDHDNKYLLVLAERIYQHQNDRLWVNENFVIFEELSCKYSVKIYI